MVRIDKDYSELYRDVIWPHLEKLVKVVSGFKSRKVLLHEWVLLIEYNWASYYEASEDDSDFIARLTIWMGGLRDKFHNQPTEKEVNKILIKIFDAMTFAYFEFGGIPEVFNIIESYTNKVSNWMNSKNLFVKFNKFKNIREPVPILNYAMNNLNAYTKTRFINREPLKIKINHELHTSTDWEKEFIRVARIIVNEFLVLEDIAHDIIPEAHEDVRNLISGLETIGYTNILTDSTKKELEKYKELYLKSIKIRKEVKEHNTGRLTDKDLTVKKNCLKCGRDIYTDNPKELYCNKCLTKLEDKLTEKEDNSSFKKGKKNLWGFIKCLFGKHDYLKENKLTYIGAGTYEQRYLCRYCGKAIYKEK